jgi:hypothetical protein
MSSAPPRRHRVAAIAVIAAALALLLAGAPSAGALAPIAYNATSTSGSIVLKKGDVTNERTIVNPAATLSSTVDPSGSFVANGTFAPSFTPNQSGPFGIVIYIKAEIIQSTPFTGTIVSSGAVDATSNQFLAITVYRTTTGTVGQSNGQNPATDQVLANGSTCRVTLALHVTGQYDFQTRVLTFGQDPFTIPTFPADTRPTGGTAGCTSATASLNTQLAGPSNSLSLTFGGASTLPPSQMAAPQATGGNGQATLDGVVPPDYGSAITGYTVTPYILGVAQAPHTIPPGGPGTVTGLANGTTYTFTVAATNANGTGTASPQSNAVLVGAPAQPSFQSAAPGSLPGTASVQFWPPASNGSPILTYTVTPFIGGAAQTPQTFGAASNKVTLVGLTSGTSYTFTVKATNAVGSGPASPATNAVVVP